MEHNKKPIQGPLIVIAAVLLFALFGWLFVGVSLEGITSNAGGGCVSVVFDKASVKGTDRIVFYDGAEVITLTDKAQVRQIADLFLVANRTDLCGYYSNLRMEIYNGRKLVREIRWNDHGYELAKIYDADMAHWVFPSSEKYGQVELSVEAQELISQIIEQHRQRIK